MTTCRIVLPCRAVASPIGPVGLLVAVLTLLSATVAPAQSVQPNRGAGSRSSTVPKRSPQSAAAANPARPNGRVPAAAVRPGGATVGVMHADGTSGGREARDGGVVQAGATMITADCRQCGRRGCNECRADGGRLGLHCNGRCDAGGCPAHCPVRPDQFGYYQTRWRNWPGQGVRQVSHFDPATTPAVPPRSQIPTLEEESGVGPDGAPTALDDEEDPQQAAARDGAGGEAATETDDAAAPQAGDAAVMEPSADTEPGDALPAADDPEDAGEAREDAPQERQPESPTGGASSRSAPTTLRGETSSAFRPANPLRRSAFPGVPASGTTGAEAAPRPSATPLEPARRQDETSQWRPSRRGVPAAEGAAPLVRGVTANPGNPLR